MWLCTSTGLEDPGGNRNRPEEEQVAGVWGGSGPEQGRTCLGEVLGQLPKAREEVKHPGLGTPPLRAPPTPSREDEKAEHPHAQHGPGSRTPAPGWACTTLDESTASPGSEARPGSPGGLASALSA